MPTRSYSPSPFPRASDSKVAPLSIFLYSDYKSAASRLKRRTAVPTFQLDCAIPAAGDITQPTPEAAGDRDALYNLREHGKALDPGEVCLIMNSYLLSFSDVLFVTNRDKSSAIAIHRSMSPFDSINPGDNARYDQALAAKKAPRRVFEWRLF